MKKIIIISMMSLISLAYAVEYKSPEKLNPQDVNLSQSKESIKVEVNNESYLYEFDFKLVGQKDTSIRKYMTNNTKSVETLTALQETLNKNWKLGSEYTQNLKLKTDNKVGNQMTCKYNNGLIIKVKAYGDYETSCPLKN